MINLKNEMSVLVVEDEPAISRLLSRRLKKNHFDVKCVASLSEAKEALKETDWDFIFLDYILEDGRSKDLADQKYLKFTDKVFLMSAFMEDLDKTDFKSLNVVYLKKPFDNLTEVLENMHKIFKQE